MKVISNSNYIIRKVGTLRTQCVQRMRLRPFTPNTSFDDIVDDPNQYYADPDATDDQELFNNNLLTRTVSEHHHIEQVEENDQTGDLQMDHGLFCYKYRTRTSPLQQSPPLTVQPIPDDPIVPPITEQKPEETHESTQTRNNTTR